MSTHSSHPPDPLRILIIICRDNRYRCPYLGESRTTTAARSTTITRVGGRLPCRPTNPCGYQQVEPSPYLVSCLLFEELDFRTTGYLTAIEQVPGPSYTDGIHMSCRFDTIPYAGTIGSPDYLPLRTTIVRDPRVAI